MVDEDCHTNDQRCHEGDSALLHGQHDDGHDQLSCEDHLEEETLDDGRARAERIFSLERPGQQGGYSPSSGDRPSALHDNVAKEANPVESPANPQAEGYLHSNKVSHPQPSEFKPVSRWLQDGHVLLTDSPRTAGLNCPPLTR